MKQFILLLNHSDKSLTRYLQHRAQQGWFLTANHGNWFSFTKRPYAGERVCVVTYASDSPDLRMRDEAEDYAAFMKKNGWKHICTGGPEDIFDSKRHIFFESSDKEAKLPKTDPDLAAKAQKREKRSAWRCLIFLLLLISFGAFFLSHDFDLLISTNYLLLAGVLTAICVLASVTLCIAGMLAHANGTQEKNGFRHYLAQDKAVLLCVMAALCIVAAFVVDDLSIPDNGKSVRLGDGTVKLYDDELPLSFEDLHMPVEGNLRSRRATERHSLLAEYTHGADQSFSSLNSTQGLSRIAYTVYESRQGWVLDRIMSQKSGSGWTEQAELAALWGAERARQAENGNYALRFEGALLIFSSSKELSEADISIIRNRLLSEQDQA